MRWHADSILAAPGRMSFVWATTRVEATHQRRINKSREGSASGEGERKRMREVCRNLTLNATGPSRGLNNIYSANQINAVVVVRCRDLTQRNKPPPASFLSRNKKRKVKQKLFAVDPSYSFSHSFWDFFPCYSLPRGCFCCLYPFQETRSSWPSSKTRPQAQPPHHFHRLLCFFGQLLYSCWLSGTRAFASALSCLVMWCRWLKRFR